jgi:ketosteroid isomerase-like protein
MRAALILALSLAAAPAVAQVSPAPIVAVERAFAADGKATGVKRSFLKHSTSDAVMIGRQVRNAHAFLSAQPDPKPDEKFGLVWFPAWAGIASSGDLGFTSGPVEEDGVRAGHYFTVWQKQADGAWKWVYDGGTSATSKGEPGPAAPVVHLPVSTEKPLAPEQAMQQVRLSENAFAAAARTDQKAAHLTALAEDGRLYVGPLPPAKGSAAFAGALAAYPKALDHGEVQGGGASKAGDLAWTYGPVGWNEASEKRSGFYVHLWQRRAGGWRLVFSQILADPPPKAG